MRFVWNNALDLIYFYQEKIDHVSNAHIVCLGLNRHGCAKIIAQFKSSTLPFHVKVKVSIIKNWPRVKLKVNLPKHLPACSIAMLRCYNKWSLYCAIQQQKFDLNHDDWTTMDDPWLLWGTKIIVLTTSSFIKK